MDPYLLMPIASALLITGIPLINAKRHYGGIFSIDVPNLGSSQKFFYKVPAEETVVNLIRTDEESQLKVITNDFSKWEKSETFYNFILTQLKKGVHVTAYGVLKGHPSNKIKELIKNGLEIVVLREYATEHYLIVDNPKQLWFEQKHTNYYAYNCIFTESPNDEIWRSVNEYFKQLDTGKHINNLEECIEIN